MEYGSFFLKEELMRSIIIKCDICGEDIEATKEESPHRSLALRLFKPSIKKEEVFREICLTCEQSVLRLINSLKERNNAHVEVDRNTDAG
jgi:NAD-dependent dihydropyrimidine dehydrogenase PreA subunit